MGHLFHRMQRYADSHTVLAKCVELCTLTDACDEDKVALTKKLLEDTRLFNKDVSEEGVLGEVRSGLGEVRSGHVDLFRGGAVMEFEQSTMEGLGED